MFKRITMLKRLFLTLILALTLLPARAQKPFFFVQITDPQLGFKEKNTMAEGVRLLTETVEAINRIHPAFVIVTGDMVNNRFNEEQWEAYSRLIAQIDKDIPVWHIPGNHDLKPREEGDLQHYLDQFTKYGVDAVFSGHLHRSRFCEYGGVPYYTTSASGLTLGDGTSGLNIVTVYKDRFTAEFVPASEARNPLTR